MIKISPSSLHERHQCRRCIWIQYNHGWSWPWSAGLYPRFSALEENYVPTLNCCDVLNNFEDGPVTEAEWIGSKGLVQGKPLTGVDSYGRGDVIIGGEFDLMASYTKNGIKTPAIIDAKTSGLKDFKALKKWAKDKNLPAWEDEDELRAIYNQQYSEKYMPQLASYAYCIETPQAPKTSPSIKRWSRQTCGQRSQRNGDAHLKTLTTPLPTIRLVQPAS